MNPRNVLIVSAVFGFFVHVGPGEACLHRLKPYIMKEKRKEEKPAQLDVEDASLVQYSHASSNHFYIEIIHDESLENKTIVRELAQPPVAQNQLGGEFEEKTMNGGELEPDAEFISESTTTDATVVPASTTNPNGEDEEEEEEQLTPEDETIRKEWEGTCKSVHWKRCNKIESMFVKDVIKTQFEWQRRNFSMNCLDQPILCLRNGWTANRCHILCMAAQCNKGIYFSWDGIVDFEGPCKYRK